MRLRERLKAGGPAASAKAWVVLPEMLGEIMLSSGEDGLLWADYAMQPAALLSGAGAVRQGVAGELYAVRSGLLRSGDRLDNQRRKPLRRKSVTHVPGINRHLCDRNRPENQWSG